MNDTNKPMPTLRTDSKSVDRIGFYSCATVPADFARQLERELADVITQRDNLKSLLAVANEARGMMQEERDQLKAENADGTRTDEAYELAVAELKAENARLRGLIVESRGYLDLMGQEGIRERIDKILLQPNAVSELPTERR